MKKVLVLIVLLVCAFSLQAELKGIRVIGGAGWGVGDFKKLDLTVGCEIELSERISFILAYDYMPNSKGFNFDRVYDHFDYKYSYRFRTHMAGQYLKYRFKGSFFLKAGLIHTWTRSSVAEYQNGNKEGHAFTYKEFGLNAGLGYEYALSSKIAAQVGIDAYTIDSNNWVKGYLTLSYKII